MAGLLYRLGRFSARRHWLVIIAWIVIMAIAGGAYAAFHGTLSSSITIPGTKTQQVSDELSSKFKSASGGSGSIVFETKDGKAFTAAEKSDVKTFLGKLDDLNGVKGTVNPFTTQQQLADARQKITDGQQQIDSGRAKITSGQQQLDAQKAQLTSAQQQLDAAKAQASAAGAAAAAAAEAQLQAQQAQITAGQQQIAAAQKTIDQNTSKLDASEKKLQLNEKLLDLSKNVRVVSKDGSAATATVQFTKGTYEVPAELKDKVVAKSNDANIAGVNVYVSNDIAQTVPSVLGPGEVGGVIVAAIALFVMLGTLIGAGLPLLSALIGVGISALATLSFSGVIDYNSTTPVLGVMLGLAVGIDYSLFILHRHRSQLKQGMDVHESIGLANGTSGNAVVFAGSTVVVALAALNITGIPFLGLMGTVGAIGVAVAILIAITFTPAMLSLVGMRILRRKERRTIGDTASVRVPNKPMSTARAIITLVVGIAALLTIAIPSMSMRLGLPNGASEATDSAQYKAYKVTEAKFGAGQNSPLVVVATLPSKKTGDALTQQEVTVGQKIADQKDVSALAPVGTSKDGTVIAYQVIPKSGPSSVATENLVKDLRNLSPLSDGTKLGVAGNASGNIDVSDKLAGALPIYLIVVVGLSLIILIFVFRSFLVPLTATAGFVLSLFAAFGGLTAIYQWGWLGSVFGVHDPQPILSFLPTIEVGVLFGLAMDYQLFLVSGMREAYAHGASARVAVQRGFHAGRTVVTTAAIIMIAVFAGFIFSDSSTIQPIGFGLAFGVLVDAFVVRMLLIPAAMHLLGRSAWWFPKWLDRILPDVDVEGAKLERTHPVAGAESPRSDGHGSHAAPDAEPDAVPAGEHHSPSHRA
jgi:putative drug exporter of the RND superfamily